MKILAFVDLHGNKKALDKLIERAKKKDIDVIVNAGDFTIFGEAQDLILSKLNKIGKPVLIVHGNHEEARELKQGCGLFDNCHFIHRKIFRKNGVAFIGWGGGGFSFRDTEFEKQERKLRNAIKKGEKVVFITHAPPYKTKIDELYGQEHAGNKSFRKFIEKVKPELAISGHLHDCIGEDKIGKTKVINPGYKYKILVL